MGKLTTDHPIVALYPDQLCGRPCSTRERMSRTALSPRVLSRKEGEAASWGIGVASRPGEVVHGAESDTRGLHVGISNFRSIWPGNGLPLHWRLDRAQPLQTRPGTSTARLMTDSQPCFVADDYLGRPMCSQSIPPPGAAPPPVVESVEGFVAADGFQGSKQGMVFKTGPAGLGYYPDVSRR